MFIPSSADIHQDHGVIHNEGVRAFKNVTILGYELPWNNLSVHLQCGISLDSDHIELKIKALAQYASQGSRSYFSEDFIRSLSLVRGIQFNTRQAEAFEVIRFCA